MYIYICHFGSSWDSWFTNLRVLLTNGLQSPTIIVKFCFSTWLVLFCFLFCWCCWASGSGAGAVRNQKQGKVARVEDVQKAMAGARAQPAQPAAPALPTTPEEVWRSQSSSSIPGGQSSCSASALGAPAITPEETITMMEMFSDDLVVVSRSVLETLLAEWKQLKGEKRNYGQPDLQRVALLPPASTTPHRHHQTL